MIWNEESTDHKEFVGLSDVQPLGGYEKEKKK